MKKILFWLFIPSRLGIHLKAFIHLSSYSSSHETVTSVCYLRVMIKQSIPFKTGSFLRPVSAAFPETGDIQRHDDQAEPSSSWPAAFHSRIETWNLPLCLTQIDVIDYDYLTSSVRLQSSQGCFHLPAASLSGFFDQAALYFGNRLQGSKSAWHKRMKQNKFIPLLIALQPLLVFLPDSSASADDLRFLNFARVAGIKLDGDEKSRSIITFCDGLQIVCSSHRRMERNFLRTKWNLAKIYSSQSSQYDGSIARS